MSFPLIMALGYINYARRHKVGKRRLKGGKT